MFLRNEDRKEQDSLVLYQNNVQSKSSVPPLKFEDLWHQQIYNPRTKNIVRTYIRNEHTTSESVVQD
jgi:hypothetical protein